ncbi:MAG: elongation factor P [candidate division WOR-3 bacterium]
MKEAQNLREGEVIILNGELYKVVGLSRHAGKAQFSGIIKATLRHMKSGKVSEFRWTPEEKVEDVQLERKEMEFLYQDKDEVVLMDPETYDQVSLPRSSVENYLPFLKEGTKVKVELYNGVPIGIDFPRMVQLRVESTGSGIKGQMDNTWKEATLENGLVILVPQFIETGDLIIVDVETKRYVDRAKKL